MSVRQNAPNQFLNGPNYQKIVGFLRQHYTQKLGVTALPDRIDTRLQKTVQHYMSELSRAGVNQPVSAMNQTVVRETSNSMDQWIRKQETAAAVPAVTTTLGGSTFRGADDYSRLFEDTNTRYENMMADRTPPPAFVPTVPDFRLSQQPDDDDGGDVLAAMERIQKEREEQARGGPRLEIKEIPPHSVQLTPPQAIPAPPPLAPRPQDYIIPQEDITKYHETEYNIFLTSSDRDWLRNTVETRYNFTVNFNTGTKKNGFSYSPALQERFRNIQRIEFVKAIVPTESLTTLVRVAENNPPPGGLRYDTSRVVNVFSMPFVGVRIAELNNNGFSTKPEEDNTFAMVQYDTTWSSDALSPSSSTVSPVPVLTKSGYTGLIPKFLKTQRVYTPTPLATLQRMSIRLERHSGDLLSDESDVYALKRICMSDAFSSIGTNSTAYAVSPNGYIFIQTQKYFPHSAVGEGDSIVFQGITFKTTSAASADFLSFLQRSAGHHVVATGYVNGAGAVVDGRNEVGYCNVIVLRNRFDDPTTGSVGRTASYFGGSAMDETAFAAALDDATAEPAQTGSALLNLSRQTHIVLRIITRAVDSAANIRPDNV